MEMSKPVETIYEYVKNQIVTKFVFPGTRIIEENLTKETGISRTSVRTALTNLQYEGFVEIAPNRGTFVVKPTYEDIRNVYHVRRYLEIGALNLAFNNIDKDCIIRMEQSLQAQRELLKNFSITEYAVLNRKFHEEIVRASQNDYYIKFLNELYNKCHIYMIFYDNAKDNSGSLRTHKMLLDAIKNKDIETGIRVITQDIEIGINDITPF